MRNAMTQRQFDLIKKETFTLIAFEGDRRFCTYGGLSLLDVIHEQARITKPGRTMLIVNDFYLENRENDRCCVSWDINDYKDLFKLGSKAILRGAGN